MRFKILGVILIIALFLPIVLTYEPPVYIANPETLECKYYFAGDEKHVNPRPENFTITLGYTTSFENDEEKACDIFKNIYGVCTNSGGEITPNEFITEDEKIVPFSCECSEGRKWDIPRGCVQDLSQENQVTGQVVKEIGPGEEGFRYDRILITALIVIFIGYFFYNRKEIKELKKKINEKSDQT